MDAFSGDHEAQLRRAEALAELGRYREAIHLLSSLLADNPEDARLLWMLSVNYLNLNDASESEKALEYAERAVAAAPDSEWAHRLHSVALMRVRGTGPALRAAEAAVAASPHSPPALLTLTSALTESGFLIEAEEVAERLRQQTPERPESYMALAVVALKQGRSRDAEGEALRALELDPESAYAFRLLGSAKMRMRRWGEAASAYFESVRLNPSDALARYLFLSSTEKYLGLYWSPLLFFAVFLLGFNALFAGLAGRDGTNLVVLVTANLCILAAFLIPLWLRCRRLSPHSRRVYCLHKFGWLYRVFSRRGRGRYLHER